LSEHRREGLVLAIAVGIVGATFGVLADAAGLSLPKVVAMSALVFTGASQFAAVSVIDSGGSGLAAVGSAMLLAARNALYGPVVARLLPGRGLTRAASAHLVIDETTAMATLPDNDVDARDAFWWTGLWLWSLWNIGTVVGALLGSVIGEPTTWGLDAAFPAAFAALLAPHIRSKPGRVAALTGAAIAIVAIPMTPSGVPLLLAAIGIAPGWLARGNRGRSSSQLGNDEQ